MKSVKMTVGGSTASFNAEYASSMTQDEFIKQNTHVFDNASLISVYAKCIALCSKEVEHTVTEEDLTANPDLKAQGVEVGERITYELGDHLDAE